MGLAGAQARRCAVAQVCRCACVRVCPGTLSCRAMRLAPGQRCRDPVFSRLWRGAPPRAAGASRALRASQAAQRPSRCHSRGHAAREGSGRRCRAGADAGRIRARPSGGFPPPLCRSRPRRSPLLRRAWGRPKPVPTRPGTPRSERPCPKRGLSYPPPGKSHRAAKKQPRRRPGGRARSGGWRLCRAAESLPWARRPRGPGSSAPPFRPRRGWRSRGQRGRPSGRSRGTTGRVHEPQLGTRDVVANSRQAGAVCSKP